MRDPVWAWWQWLISIENTTLALGIMALSIVAGTVVMWVILYLTISALSAIL